ncbi:hypothetical protein E2C01_049497 [Portunus trituberculatus]|uniref:Uncharacterized protein n=1 Tax=Portunus trituberculatus TaxID=210409 RepID=A0A5B7GDW0_PORTR|nr:hypothetical protein [Portunus trituberculatus]
MLEKRDDKKYTTRKKCTTVGEEGGSAVPGASASAGREGQGSPVFEGRQIKGAQKIFLSTAPRLIGAWAGLREGHPAATR